MSPRAVGGCLASLDDVEALPPVNLLAYWQIEVWLEAVSLLGAHFGREVFLRGNCDQAPFSLASMMRGASAWMINLLTDPAGCHQLLDYCTGVTSQFIRLMARAGGAYGVQRRQHRWPGDDLSKMYAEFAAPTERRVIEVAHECRLPYALHICGNADAILAGMAGTGTDAVELDYKTDAAKAREVLGDSIAFIGNIDPSGVIAGDGRRCQTCGGSLDRDHGRRQAVHPERGVRHPANGAAGEHPRPGGIGAGPRAAFVCKREGVK